MTGSAQEKLRLTRSDKDLKQQLQETPGAAVEQPFIHFKEENWHRLQIFGTVQIRQK